MKKYVFTAIAATMMLAVTLCLLAQVPPGQGQGQTPGGQGRGQAPGAQGRGGARGGGGMVNPETVNAAVAEIEKQVAALKKAMEGAQMMPGGMPGGGGQGTQKPVMGGNRAGGANQAMMAENQKRMLAVRAAAEAIADQVLVLKGNQAQIEQQDVITELESIVSLANQEKAAGTAALTKGIIDDHQKAFADKAAKLGIPMRGGMGNRGGAFTPPPGGFKYLDYDEKVIKK